MKKTLFTILITITGSYTCLCICLFLFQEHLIFFPQQLSQDYQFQFDEGFDELDFKTVDGTSLSGVLFKADSTKGLVFVLHGNAGSINSCGNAAKVYTDLNYDVFFLDYRGYGKSEGTISGQKQLFEDNQFVYDSLKKGYNEEDIIIMGYSIGTGMAAKLASDNKPQQLVLQAPYYNMTELMKQRMPFIPTYILKYTFATNDYLRACNMPITIFHGTRDQVIPHTSSLRLQEEFKSQIKLIVLEGQGHNGISENEQFEKELKSILAD
jgi:alpha-beta hydrolase superfamily lysophospholipase